MIIINREDARSWVSFIRYAEEQRKNGVIYDEDDKAKTIETDIKKALRAYYKKEQNADPFKLVADYSIDGYIQRITMPDTIQNAEDAERYYLNNYYKECKPSQYDCTGQLFTAWYKVGTLNGRPTVWERVCADI